MTITGAEAYEAMRTHHQMLSEQLAAHVSAVSEAVTTGQPHQAAVAGLVAYLAGEVLPHAAAEEQTIYPAASEHADLVGTVSAMTAEHKTLSAAAERLASLTGSAAAAGQARQIAELFAEHAARENDVLLPALLADHDTDLAALLAQMHSRTEEAGKASQAHEAPAGDPQATVLSLLLEAATALAQAGQAERACRMAASAWAALHEPRPDLAVKVTAVLHGLARRVNGGPAQAGPPASGRGPGAKPADPAGDPDLDVRDLPPARRLSAPGPAQVGEAGPDSDGEEEPELDVRQLAHGQRHDVIFTAYRALGPGAGFVLVSDHDPLPLRYQFEAGHQGEFTWDYLEAGPQAWRVRIGRAAA